MSTSLKSSALARRHRGKLFGLGLLGGLLGAALVYFFWRAMGSPPPLETAQAWRAELLAWLQSIPPWAFILAFAILPALGVPLSPFYLTVGPVMGGIGWGMLTAWCCIAINIAFAYGLTAGIAHPLIERLVAKRGIRIPRVTPANQLRVTLIVRLSPLPYSLQNFALALGKVPFRFYMIWSVAVQATIGAGVILFGDSLLKGNVGAALLGLFLILLIGTAVSWWRKRQTASPLPENGLGT